MRRRGLSKSDGKLFVSRVEPHEHGCSFRANRFSQSIAKRVHFRAALLIFYQ